MSGPVDLADGNTDQKRSVSSPAPVTMVWPSGDTARYSTRSVWPVFGKGEVVCGGAQVELERGEDGGAGGCGGAATKAPWAAKHAWCVHVRGGVWVCVCVCACVQAVARTLAPTAFPCLVRYPPALVPLHAFLVSPACPTPPRRPPFPPWKRATCAHVIISKTGYCQIHGGTTSWSAAARTAAHVVTTSSAVFSASCTAFPNIPATPPHL